jgi:hypothetical protein
MDSADQRPHIPMMSHARFLRISLGISLSLALIASAAPASAQFGGIFGNNPPRPPGAVPNGPPDPIVEDEEEVPDLPPQGRVLPTRPGPPQQPGQPGNIVPRPGAVQTQPLAPPPGTAAAPPQGAPQPLPGVASVPPAQQQKQLPRNVPGTPPTVQPGDEIVTEPPGVKIANKQATFSGLDKITGRIISFDADIGETVQFGALRVTPRACYTRPPTEATNTDAFIEVDEITLKGEVKHLFGGWMFASSPGLHAVQHSIYDVWLTDCKGPEQTIASTQPDPAPAPRVPAPQQKRQPQQAQQPIQRQPQQPRTVQPQPQPQVQPPPGPPPTPFPPFFGR